jgi:hypothetical protein
MSFILNIFIIWNKLKFIIFFISFNPKFINSCVIIKLKDTYSYFYNYFSHYDYNYNEVKISWHT